MRLIKTISNLQIRYYRNASTEPAGTGHEIPCDPRITLSEPLP